MKLHTIALGCQMSAADAGEMSTPLLRRGLGAAEGPEDADAILISTCTVRQHAEDRALSLIGSLRPWREASRDRVLIVAGCAAERLGPWIRERFPYVDLVVGAKSIEQYPRLLDEALGARFDALLETRAAFGEATTDGGAVTTDGSAVTTDGSPSSQPPSGNDSTTVTTDGSPSSQPPSGNVLAAVTIMRGCNYSCSYCIVPAVRGRELYRPVETILEETRRRVAAGAREIMLLGQTVNSYRREENGGTVRFAQLLRLVGAQPGVARVRFMSPHPHYVDDAMLDAMAETPAVCPQLHLPAQSGSDRILKKMRRNYTAAGLLETAATARRRLGDVCVTTDIIVGFPSETDEDFEATLDLVRRLQPAGAYCFKYSPRDSTESAAWADDVPGQVKEERLARLNGLVDGLTVAALASHVGRKVQVLVEQEGFGRTAEGFKVRFGGAAAVGSLAPVLVSRATRRTLLGEIHEF